MQLEILTELCSSDEATTKRRPFRQPVPHAVGTGIPDHPTFITVSENLRTRRLRQRALYVTDGVKIPPRLSCRGENGSRAMFQQAATSMGEARQQFDDVDRDNEGKTRP